jgi:hypothetical protein
MSTAENRKRRHRRVTIGRQWPFLIAVAVLMVAGYAVLRVREASREISFPPVTNTIPATVVQINPKNVTYEVFGVLGGGGKVTYANLSSAPVEVALSSLPWSVSESTMSPAVSLSLVTQVEGDQVGCRITVDGTVRDEKLVNHPAAAAACTVTAA